MGGGDGRRRWEEEMGGGDGRRREERWEERGESRWKRAAEGGGRGRAGAPAGSIPSSRRSRRARPPVHGPTQDVGCEHIYCPRECGRGGIWRGPILLLCGRGCDTRQLAAALTCENLACSSEACASRMHCGLSASPLAPRPHSQSRCAACPSIPASTTCQTPRVVSVEVMGASRTDQRRGAWRVACGVCDVCGCVACGDTVGPVHHLEADAARRCRGRRAHAPLGRRDDVELGVEERLLGRRRAREREARGLVEPVDAVAARVVAARRVVEGAREAVARRKPKVGVVAAHEHGRPQLTSRARAEQGFGVGPGVGLSVRLWACGGWRLSVRDRADEVLARHRRALVAHRRGVLHVQLRACSYSGTCMHGEQPLER